MKALFRHLLLFGVILGLIGQGVAFASPRCPMMQHTMMQQEQAQAMVGVTSGTMAGMPDCAMVQPKSSKAPAPCKEMGAGCFAMAGCSAMLGLDSSTVGIALPLTHAVAAIGTEQIVLIGRSDPPDPYPPSHLG